MKTLKFLIIYFAVLVCFSCNKSIDDVSMHYPLLQPAKTDINAGSWKPILLTAPDLIAVPQPVSVTSPEYITQINEIKSVQATLSTTQKDAIQYWGAGAVLRWNEITRALVAKYNLPPVNNPDGSYPFPDPNNPLAYPFFPFANPPYAARAYAYVSAACYDALVACHYYKKLYNRPAPYVVRPEIPASLPKSDLPSYPSEDAVVAGAMWEMLRLLFPGEQAQLQRYMQEHMDARIASGANVRSDIEAGLALGKSVAALFVARARTDRAGAAAGNPAVWQALKEKTEAQGEIAWESQEVPARPPMLPLFGKVRTWLFDSATLIAIRPEAPPSVHSAQFKAELQEVYDISKNLTRDQIRIAQFWSDGVGTYTPPGHWNAIAADAFVQKNMSEVRWARNMALLNMGLMDAIIACWDVKYLHFNPRPSQMDPRIKTVTGLPNFPAYTSGHSTFSGTAATILGYIVKEKADIFMQMAEEASMSRIYGAIHYRSDCVQGLLCGKRVGAFAIQRAQQDGAGD